MYSNDVLVVLTMCFRNEPNAEMKTTFRVANIILGNPRMKRLEHFIGTARLYYCPPIRCRGNGCTGCWEDAINKYKKTKEFKRIFLDR
jgi:hypothetical protein